MTQRKLRAVKDGETARPEEIPSLVDAIAAGDQLQILRAQRRDIAECLPNEKGPAKAALHRQLTLISKEIDAIEVQRAQALIEEAQERGPTPDEEWDEAAL